MLSLSDILKFLVLRPLGKCVSGYFLGVFDQITIPVLQGQLIGHARLFEATSRTEFVVRYALILLSVSPWLGPHSGQTQKFQRHFRFPPPRTSYEFEDKTCKTFIEKCCKNSTGREYHKLGVSVDVHK